MVLPLVLVTLLGSECGRVPFNQHWSGAHSVKGLARLNLIVVKRTLVATILGVKIHVYGIDFIGQGI